MPPSLKRRSSPSRTPPRQGSSERNACSDGQPHRAAAQLSDPVAAESRRGRRLSTDAQRNDGGELSTDYDDGEDERSFSSAKRRHVLGGVDGTVEGTGRRSGASSVANTSSARTNSSGASSSAPSPAAAAAENIRPRPKEGRVAAAGNTLRAFFSRAGSISDRPTATSAGSSGLAALPGFSKEEDTEALHDKLPTSAPNAAVSSLDDGRMWANAGDSASRAHAGASGGAAAQSRTLKAPAASTTCAEGSGARISAGAPRSAAMGAPSAPAPPKRLVIRPFKRPPQLPEEYFNRSWNGQLKVAVAAVHNKVPVAQSLEELYQLVEDLCRHRMVGRLSQRLEADINEHVRQRMAALSATALTEEGGAESFLSHVDGVWNDHYSEMLTIRSIFLFLDAKNALGGGEHLWDMGLRIFEKHLRDTENVERHAVSGILSQVEKNRNGEMVDKALLKRLLRMFCAVGRYGISLEKPLLDAAAEHYRIESVRSFQQLDLAQYLRHVDQLLVDEEVWVTQYLNESSRAHTIRTVEVHMIANHLSEILGQEFARLCDENRVDDLRRLYRLFGRVDGHENCHAYAQLAEAFAKYVECRGSEYVTTQEKDDEMIEQLLAFKALSSHIVSEAFGGDEGVSKALKHAFEVLINKRQNKPAELLAKHLDGILKVGNKKFPEEDRLERELDHAMQLFRFIHGKDIFEAFYKRDLSKRLLFDRSASLDLENVMIVKLKAECGNSFTNKLEGMFKDVKLSGDLMKAFTQHHKSVNHLPNVHLMSVNVLASDNWPAPATQEKLKLPQELLDYEHTFKAFYVEKHKGRQVLWDHTNGCLVLNAHFPKRLHFVTVSMYQGLVLLLFNSSEELTYAEIAEGTGLSAEKLKLTLLSLACGDKRVLRKTPKGPSVSETDVFTYNDKFNHMRVNVKINSIQMKLTAEENRQTTERVFQERPHHIDSAIVGIMKMRRRLSHPQLMTELWGQLKFPQTPAALKARIEALLEQEYIKRDEDNPNSYSYVA